MARCFVKATTAIATGLFLFSLSLPAHAAMQTFTKEYTYQASDVDSKVTSRAIALNQVTSLLLKEIGVYIQSEFKDKSSNKSPDEVSREITTLTAGVVTANVIDEKWDGKTYWLKAEVKADPDEVAKKVDEFRGDKQKSKELEELRKRQDESNKEIARLRKELESGKADKAKTAEYNTAVDSLSAADWFKKGYAAGMAGHHEDAISAFSKAIELDPKYGKTYGNRGVVYANIGNHQQAIRDYDKAIELEPKYATTYYNRGNAYNDLGNYQQAIRDFDKAIELDPKLTVAYDNRGYSYDKLGNDQQAIKDFDKAIELEPTARRYISRGIAYNNLNNYQQAIKDFDKAIGLDPKHAFAYNNRGFTYFRLGNLQQAINDFDKAIEFDPKFSLPYTNRGNAYFKLGNRQQAIKDWQVAARLGHKGAQDHLQSQGISW